MRTRDLTVRQWLETLDSYANATYGRSIASSVVAGICVRCGRPAHPFTVPEAATRYAAVGLCERCYAERSSSDEGVQKDSALPLTRTPTTISRFGSS